MSNIDKNLRLTFSIIGALLLIVGILVTWLAPGSIYRDIAYIESLQSAGATILSDSRPGREVLIEGYISERNPAQLHTYVAYTVEVLETNSDGDKNWEYQTSIAPPLLIALSDGLVQVEGYDISSTNDRSTEASNTRYRGLEAGDPVMAIGVSAAGEEYPRLEGEFIAYGNRADYIASQWKGIIIWAIFGLLLTGVGVFFIALVLKSIVRSGRKSPQSNRSVSQG